MLWLLLAAAICVALHLSAIVLVAMRFGIPVREVSFGLGPTLLRIGLVRIKALPLGGSVTLKDSTVELLEKEDQHDAIDRQPTATQLLVGAAGPLALVLLSFLVLQLDGLAAFAGGFAQWVEGAFSPYDTAQQLLRRASHAASATPFVPLLALVAAKFAALNLLPLPAFNGGFLLKVLFERAPLAERWPPLATQVLHLFFFSLALSWLGALILYGLGAA